MIMRNSIRGALLPLVASVLLAACSSTPRTAEPSHGSEGSRVSLQRDLRSAADAVLRNESPQAALDAYRQALQMDPADAEAWAGVSQAYRQLGAMREAGAAVQRAVQLRPDNSRVLEAAGLLMASTHRWEIAAGYLQSAVDKGASSWQLFNALGVCADMQSNYAAASTHYAQAIALQPSALLYNNQGYSLYMAHNYGAATTSFESALRLEPKNALAWRNLSLVRMRQGELEGALQAAFKGGEIPAALNDIGYIAMLDGQNPTAKYFFELAIDMAPSKHYPRAQENLQRLAHDTPSP